ncbi:hypothetical protein TeGR_g7423, partial [Tetraparma gracilis]
MVPSATLTQTHQWKLLHAKQATEMGVKEHTAATKLLHERKVAGSLEEAVGNLTLTFDGRLLPTACRGAQGKLDKQAREVFFEKCLEEEIARVKLINDEIIEHPGYLWTPEPGQESEDGPASGRSGNKNQFLLLEEPTSILFLKDNLTFMRALKSPANSKWRERSPTAKWVRRAMEAFCSENIFATANYANGTFVIAELSSNTFVSQEMNGIFESLDGVIVDGENGITPDLCVNAIERIVQLAESGQLPASSLRIEKTDDELNNIRRKTFPAGKTCGGQDAPTNSVVEWGAFCLNTRNFLPTGTRVWKSWTDSRATKACPGGMA